MKYSEELKNAMLTLLERYGVTLSDVPERFKEKLGNLMGNTFKDEIEEVFKPLELGYLRNLRVRATQRVEPAKLHETSNLLSTMEELSHDEVLETLSLWMDLFKVRTEISLEELEDGDFFSPPDPNEFVADVEPIVDNIRVTAPLDVETVVNQFDSDVPVDEPQVDDYDGNFSDVSFETVTDFKISDEESDLIEHLESASTSPGYDAYTKEHPTRIRLDRAKQEKKKHKKRDNVAVYVPPAENETAKGSVDSAFKALRDGKAGLASRIMMEQARNGDIRAQFHLGEFYISGTGIEKSPEKAKYWLRKASSRGSMPAKTKLEEIEKEENSGGCCGCAVIVFVVIIVLKLIGSLI